ncbi:transcriptional regulator, GntR family [Hathewaya proteolytica DSM 3090]|uniref:Transcriptional regulator, GntR family n=1 Tax=Hathewaya proteolytica DSM 3090 TaxID=1121331 RepID=A0A1M6P3N9_9CLOT|nr:GntR family transcriptional regulator [Hathewaya proteolytica]SHK02587.1 transcriptional regulator, GntR family [Hathewaya proteolytica DSM 3090]
MILRIDFDSEVPIYMQIKNQIVEGIAKGTIEDGEELPSVRSLADDIGINMHTVNKAYNLLKEDGYVKIDRRRGAIVSLSLCVSNEKFQQEFRNNLEYYAAECFNRGIDKEDIIKSIEDIFKDFRRGEQ